MEAGVDDRVSLLVLRAWVDGDDGPSRLRVRVTAVADIAARDSDPQTTVFADVEQVCAFVRAWLTELDPRNQRM